MKKTFLIVAASMLSVLVGCKNVSVEERMARYREKSTAMMEAFRSEIAALGQDSTMTEEGKMKIYEEKEAAFTKEYVAYALDVARKNKDNALAPAALQDCYYMAEPEQLEQVIASLKGPAAEDAFVQKLSKNLAAKRGTAEGCKFADFEVDGVKFSDFVGKGKYVLVDFWASWCVPCQREIPFIKAVYEKYRGDDFDVLSVAVWDKPEDTAAAAVKHGVVWSQIVNAQAVPTELYGIEGIPHIMLVGPDGTILKRGLRGAGIEKAVAEYLKR